MQVHYYETRELIPVDMLADMKKARVKITNYHAFKLRETLELSKGTRRVLAGRDGELSTLETEGEMVRRVASDLMNLGPIVVLNDEAHHCYRERPDSEEQVKLTGDALSQAKADAEAARLWINGIEAFSRVLARDKRRGGGVIATYDLSATPFFLRGSGYVEGTLFPWVVSDFSLMDAIECGIVKLPRMPVADNTVSEDLPMFRNLWDHISKDAGLPKKGRISGKQQHDPNQLPTLLKTALDNLYGHYKQTFDVWEEAGSPVPPVMIVVCNNTATSKLVYDYISGYEVKNEEGDVVKREPATYSLLSNFNSTTGSRHAKPSTLLIDSYQLESGEDVDKDFRDAFADEIENFRREVAQREGAGAVDKITDTDILREVMNTVGKDGKLGADIRCVVSVSMLTEGWDANNVTHILGVRAFGTQLLCEQVVGRGLRRSSYKLNDDGLFDVEYAEVLGIPFEFTAAQSIVKTPPQRQKLFRIEAKPDRAHLEITFPRLVGYRKDLPPKNLVANFSSDSDYTLSPEKVGPGETQMEGIVGEGYTLSAQQDGNDRESTIAYNLTKYLLDTRFRESADEETPIHLFPQVKRIVRRWLKEHFSVAGGIKPSAVFTLQRIRDEVRDILYRGITTDDEQQPTIK